MASPTSFLFLVLYISPGSFTSEIYPNMYSLLSILTLINLVQTTLIYTTNHNTLLNGHLTSSIHPQNTHFLYKIYFSYSHPFSKLKHHCLLSFPQKYQAFSQLSKGTLYSLSPLSGMMDSFCYSCLSSDFISERPFTTTLFYVLQNTYHIR